MRAGKSAAKLQNGDQAEAEADRRRHQPELNQNHLAFEPLGKVSLANLVS